MQIIKNIKSTSLLMVLFFFSLSVFAQNDSGIIKFERKKDWITIMNKLPWMTTEDKDRARLSWGKNQGKGVPYELHFVKSKSIYFEPERENEFGYSWNQAEYKIIRDYEKNSSNDLIETLGKKYVIEDLPIYKWKIHNEIKEVGGYLCMKAETYSKALDQKVFAWFTDAIPVQGGPEGYYGLPGMILELEIDNGALIVTAVEVNITNTQVELPIPKKIKGKKISRSELDEKIMMYIEDSKDAKRNPFWALRY